jgi:micrococcal nuclease
VDVSPPNGWRHLALVALVASLIEGTACGGRPPVPVPPARSDAVVPVTKVTDGDTIHVAYGGSDERVRLIGVNTPEVDWYGGRAECFGSQAGLYARARLSGARVKLVFDVERRDRYGRLLAYVYVGRELFNLTLVRLGYGRADPVPPDTKLAGDFARAQDRARSSGVGLWSACRV